MAITIFYGCSIEIGDENGNKITAEVSEQRPFHRIGGNMQSMQFRTQYGLALSFVIFVILVIVLAAIVVLGGGLAVRNNFAKHVEPVPTGACACKDIDDIENRMREANAAIAEYQTMIGELPLLDAREGKVTMYSEALYAYGQDNIQIAISAVTKQGAHSLKGDTLTDCTTKVSAATACMKASAQVHENVHSATCQKMKQGKSASDMSIYKNSMTMKEMWNDEIAGYQAEIAYLGNELQIARKDTSCSRKWTCDVDGKSYEVHSECERSCRPTLGSPVKLGFRCVQAP